MTFIDNFRFISFRIYIVEALIKILRRRFVKDPGFPWDSSDFYGTQRNSEISGALMTSYANVYMSDHFGSR